jgi:ribosome biogenesis GTPase
VDEQSGGASPLDNVSFAPTLALNFCMDLASLGWTASFAQAFAPHAAAGLVPARVALEHRHAYIVLTEQGEIPAEVVGRLLKREQMASLPVVGDWVALAVRPGVAQAHIHAVLPRKSRFSRRAPGERDEEQIVAANLDTVFLVCGLDADFNPRRIERYLTLARGSGAEPVVVLNKSDLCSEAPARVASTRALAGGADVHAISAQDCSGLDALARYLQRGRTVALLGSSGVGKSTLVNCLVGHERQEIGDTREDDRGRHTTTRRELIALPGGALLIDTPGMRELQLWDRAVDGLLAMFPEIMGIGADCRFRDCRHETEPGCAVQAALTAGTLAVDRFASFQKLRAELEASEARASGSGRTRGGGGRRRTTGRRIMRG